MNKTELVTEVSKRTQVAKNIIADVVNSTFESIVNAVKKGDRVAIMGLGTFEPHNLKERKGRNPQTGAELVVKAKTVPKFRPGKEFKEAVNA